MHWRDRIAYTAFAAALALVLLLTWPAIVMLARVEVEHG